MLTETWITNADDLDEYSLSGYQPIESKCRSIVIPRSGGVAFFVKKGINFKAVKFECGFQCHTIQVHFNELEIKTIAQLIDLKRCA